VNYADYTLMRGLPMDFPEDPQVRDLSDQWLLGPALMPCPVYEYKARSREVYFPAGLWYDFYTGDPIPGGERRTVEAPYERMPLYVRAGSIVPVGPAMEWSDQKPADNLLLLVYAGADAHFTLYEDDGLTYGYERGEYSTIDLDWDNTARTLTIGERKGTYPDMLHNRKFRLICVDEAHPFVWNPDAPGQAVQYEGQSLSIKL
jgi:alpha-D-xyloside xylohydrolase